MDHLSFLCILKYSLPGPSLKAPSLVCVWLITGLCVEADGSWDGKQKKQEGRGQSQLAAEKKGCKIYLWLESSKCALDFHIFFQFITYWITVSDLWTPLGKEGKDSEGQRCISWRQDSVKDINGRIVLRTESKKDNREAHTSIIDVMRRWHYCMRHWWSTAVKWLFLFRPGDKKKKSAKFWHPSCCSDGRKCVRNTDASNKWLE